MKRRGFLKLLGGLVASAAVTKEVVANTDNMHRFPPGVKMRKGAEFRPWQRQFKLPPNDNASVVTRVYTGTGGSQHIYMGEAPQCITIKREMSEEIGAKLGEELDRQVLQAFADTKPFYQKINKDRSWLKKK